MPIDVGKAIGYLDLDTSGFEKGFKTAFNDLKSFQDKSLSIGDKFSSIGDGLTSAGRSLTTGVTLPLAGLGTVAVKSAVDFETAFTGVRKTVDATEEEFALLSAGIKEMSSRMPQSASEIAGVMEVAGQLGVRGTDNLLDFTETMIMLGDSTNLSSEEAATSIARVMNIMGTSGSDVSRFGSTIVDLGNNFATTESEIVAMTNRLAAGGKLAGLTEPELMALATAMSSVGIEAEAGGTAMTQTFNEIEKAVVSGGDNLAEFARVAGMSSQEFAEAWETTPIAALQSFIAGLGNLDSQGESAVLVLEDLGLTGIRQSNMLKSLGLASDLLADSIDTANTAWGNNTALMTEANTRYGTTESKLSMLKNNAENLAASFGELLLPVVEKLSNTISQLISWLDSLDEEQKNTIVTIGLVAASIGPVALILGNVLSTASKVINLLQMLGPVLSGISAPVVAIVAVIGTLVAAFKHLWDTNEEFRNKISEIWDGIKEKFDSFGQGIVDRLNDLGFEFKNITDVIKSVWEAFCNFLAPIFEGVFSQISNILGTAFDVLLGLFDYFSGVFTGDWDKAWEGVKEIFSAVWNFLKNSLENFLNTILGIFGTSLDEIKEKWEAAWDKVKSFFTDTWDNMKTGVKNAIQNIGDKIRGFVSDIVNWFKDLPGKMLDIGKNIVTGIWDGISGAASWLWDKVTGFGNDMIGWFKGVFGIASPSKVMKSQGGFLMQGLAQGIEGSIGVVKSQISNLTNTINSTLDDAFNTARVLDVSANIPELESSSRSARHLAKKPESSVNNQYNFTYNSPKAVTPTVASKLLKQTAQQLALDF